jgi:hypothetical protein
MKSLNKEWLHTSGQIDQISRKWDALLRFVHPVIASGHCDFQSKLLVTLIMDYVPGSDLS